MPNSVHTPSLRRLVPLPRTKQHRTPVHTKLRCPRSRFAFRTLRAAATTFAGQHRTPTGSGSFADDILTLVVAAVGL